MHVDKHKRSEVCEVPLKGYPTRRQALVRPSTAKRGLPRTVGLHSTRYFVSKLFSYSFFFGRLVMIEFLCN